jgi:hypothetical protein
MFPERNAAPASNVNKKRVMFICEVLVIPGATSMWNILLIENLPIGELLPACFLHMFSKENEGVVAALIQNLGAKPRMIFSQIGSVKPEPGCCRMKCGNFLSHNRMHGLLPTACPERVGGLGNSNSFHV